MYHACVVSPGVPDNLLQACSIQGGSTLKYHTGVPGGVVKHSPLAPHVGQQRSTRAVLWAGRASWLSASGSHLCFIGGPTCEPSYKCEVHAWQPHPMQVRWTGWFCISPHWCGLYTGWHWGDAGDMPAGHPPRGMAPIPVV